MFDAISLPKVLVLESFSHDRERIDKLLVSSKQETLWRANVTTVKY